MHIALLYMLVWYLSYAVSIFPFSHTIPSVVLDTPARLSLTAYIFLMEASLYEVREKIAPQ